MAQVYMKDKGVATDCAYFYVETSDGALVRLPKEQIRTLSGLPAVSADDNGKILRVVDGSWTAQALTNAEEVTY